MEYIFNYGIYLSTYFFAPQVGGAKTKHKSKGVYLTYTI